MRSCDIIILCVCSLGWKVQYVCQGKIDPGRPHIQIQHKSLFYLQSIQPITIGQRQTKSKFVVKILNWAQKQESYKSTFLQNSH